VLLEPGGRALHGPSVDGDGTEPVHRSVLAGEGDLGVGRLVLGRGELGRELTLQLEQLTEAVRVDVDAPLVERRGRNGRGRGRIGCRGGRGLVLCGSGTLGDRAVAAGVARGVSGVSGAERALV